MTKIQGSTRTFMEGKYTQIKVAGAMDDEIEATLRAYIRDQCLPQGSALELDDTRNLFESGTLDSAGLISYVGFIELTYGLKIPDEDLVPAHFVSVAATGEYIRSRRHPRPDGFQKDIRHAGIEEMHSLGSR